MADRLTCEHCSEPPISNPRGLRLCYDHYYGYLPVPARIMELFLKEHMRATGLPRRLAIEWLKDRYENWKMEYVGREFHMRPND